MIMLVMWHAKTMNASGHADNYSYCILGIVSFQYITATFKKWSHGGLFFGCSDSNRNVSRLQ